MSGWFDVFCSQIITPNTIPQPQAHPPNAHSALRRQVLIVFVVSAGHRDLRRTPCTMYAEFCPKVLVAVTLHTQ